MNAWLAGQQKTHLRYASEQGLCPKNKNHVLCTWMIIYFFLKVSFLIVCDFCHFSNRSQYSVILIRAQSHLPFLGFQCTFLSLVCCVLQFGTKELFCKLTSPAAKALFLPPAQPADFCKTPLRFSSVCFAGYKKDFRTRRMGAEI